MKSPEAKWLERAKYDMETAQGMFRIRKYLYTVFMCQQVIEKLFKGLLVCNGKASYPSHNLFKLAEDCGVLDECEGFDEGFLADLSPYYIKARYGDYKQKMSELCDRKTALGLLNRTERMYKWLNGKIGN